MGYIYLDSEEDLNERLLAQGEDLNSACMRSDALAKHIALKIKGSYSSIHGRWAKNQPGDVTQFIEKQCDVYMRLYQHRIAADNEDIISDRAKRYARLYLQPNSAPQWSHLIGSEQTIASVPGRNPRRNRSYLLRLWNGA